MEKNNIEKEVLVLDYIPSHLHHIIYIVEYTRVTCFEERIDLDAVRVRSNELRSAPNFVERKAEHKFTKDGRMIVSVCGNYNTLKEDTTRLISELGLLGATFQEILSSKCVSVLSVIKYTTHVYDMRKIFPSAKEGEAHALSLKIGSLPQIDESQFLIVASQDGYEPEALLKEEEEEKEEKECVDYENQFIHLRLVDDTLIVEVRSGSRNLFLHANMRLLQYLTTFAIKKEKKKDDNC